MRFVCDRHGALPVGHDEVGLGGALSTDSARLGCFAWAAYSGQSRGRGG